MTGVQERTKQSCKLAAASEACAQQGTVQAYLTRPVSLPSLVMRPIIMSPCIDSRDQKLIHKQCSRSERKGV